MNMRANSISHQRGVALITSLLLLLIITILALSMFRSFGTQEKIAGNLREKERALHAAESAEQYAEWWLLQQPNLSTIDVACGAGAPIDANLNITQGQVCTTPTSFTGLGIDPTAVPWPIQYMNFTPPGMSTTPGVPGKNGDPPYAGVPAFYIADLGVSADSPLYRAYQIDAFGYAGTTTTVAEVESVYEVKVGTGCGTCP
jgi:type IV pilus assembly protein PilX